MTRDCVTRSAVRVRGTLTPVERSVGGNSVRCRLLRVHWVGTTPWKPVEAALAQRVFFRVFGIMPLCRDTEADTIWDSQARMTGSVRALQTLGLLDPSKDMVAPTVLKHTYYSRYTTLPPRAAEYPALTTVNL